MRARFPLLILVIVLTLSACSSGPNAQDWAAQVCKALDPWGSSIDDLTAQTKKAMGPKASPAESQDKLVKLLGGAAKASDKAYTAVVKAGVPDVDSGDAIANRFRDSLKATRNAYRDAHDSMESLDAGDSGFYDDVTKVMDQLATDYTNVPQVSKLSSDELRDAFAQLPQCA